VIVHLPRARHLEVKIMGLSDFTLQMWASITAGIGTSSPEAARFDSMALQHHC
jgi:hypothetical protein